MPLGLAEPGCEKCVDQSFGHSRSYGPSAHADDVHMIVLNSLPGGEVIVNQSSAGAGNLVRAIAAPTPLPQIATSRYSFPAATARASGITKSG